MEICKAFAECTAIKGENRIPESNLYAAYTLWAKDNGYRQMTNKNFVTELRRLDVRRGGVGDIVVGLIQDYSENPFE